MKTFLTIAAHQSNHRFIAQHTKPDSFAESVSQIDVQENKESFEITEKNQPYLDQAQKYLRKPEAWNDVTNNDVLAAFNKALDDFMNPTDKAEAGKFLLEAIGFPGDYEALVTFLTEQGERPFAWPPKVVTETEYGFVTTQFETDDNTIDANDQLKTEVYVTEKYFTGMQAFIKNERDKNRALSEAADTEAKTAQNVAKTETKEANRAEKKANRATNDEKNKLKNTAKTENREAYEAQKIAKKNEYAQNRVDKNTDRESDRLDVLDSKLKQQQALYEILLKLQALHEKQPPETDELGRVVAKPDLKIFGQGIRISQQIIPANMQTEGNFTAVHNLWENSGTKDNDLMGELTILPTTEAEKIRWLKQLDDVSVSLSQAIKKFDEMYGHPYRQAERKLETANDQLETAKENLRKAKNDSGKASAQNTIDKIKGTITKLENTIDNLKPFQSLLEQGEKTKAEAMIGEKSAANYLRVFD